MKVKLRPTTQCAMVIVILCFLPVSLVHGQAKPATAPAPKLQMSEQAFKDVQVLKGIPVDQFLDTMGFFAASTGLNCTGCHGPKSAGSWAAYADENKLKTTARKMILMTRAINQANFGGASTVTCYSCHRGDETPDGRPSLAEQYSTDPTLGDPNDVVVRAEDQDPHGPTADQVFDKYLDAIGGAQRVATLTNYIAKGTYVGWDTEQEVVPVDIYAKAPNQRTTIVHTANGDSVRTFDGTAGYLAAPDKPLPLIALSGGDLFGAKIDAMVFLPANIQKVATQWRVGSVAINGNDTVVVQGNNPGQVPLKLYFDPKSGLLSREVRISTTGVGQIPTEIDYSNYREVAGVKIPFKWIVTWTDGQATVVLNSVQPNVAIDPAEFAKPAPSADKIR